MRYCSSKHLKEMIMELELLILCEVGYAFRNDHCVLFVVINDRLCRESHDLILLEILRSPVDLLLQLTTFGLFI
jgi:hypothetical protein